MSRILLVTNDFPPRQGGIQSYLVELVQRLVTYYNHDITIYTSNWPGADQFDHQATQNGYRIIRHPTRILLPGPILGKQMQRIIGNDHIQTVWFGAAAPLAIMSSYARSLGVEKIIASTHGHEVGWSMIPGARSILRYIGNHSDIITFVSHYTRTRLLSAFGPQAAFEYLPPGVDPSQFFPDPQQGQLLRSQLGLENRPIILCISRLVPRKGQDALITALPHICRSIPNVALVIVGEGPYKRKLIQLTHHYKMSQHVIFTGSVPANELVNYYRIANVFAMPCRTRGKGLDVEGFGIVFLEAAATGIPILVGNSGGAPETVIDHYNGLIIDGRSISQIVEGLTTILMNPSQATHWGHNGRQEVIRHWNWDRSAQRLDSLL